MAFSVGKLPCIRSYMVCIYGPNSQPCIPTASAQNKRKTAQAAKFILHTNHGKREQGHFFGSSTKSNLACHFRILTDLISSHQRWRNSTLLDTKVASFLPNFLNWCGECLSLAFLAPFAIPHDRERSCLTHTRP
jgi:hypothetical protein